VDQESKARKRTPRFDDRIPFPRGTLAVPASDEDAGFSLTPLRDAPSKWA
jgi:hypothetical protein